MAFLSPALARAQDTVAAANTGLVVLVTIRESAVPLQYSVLAVPALKLQVFTNVNGVGHLWGLDAGQYHLRVLHVGYTPADVPVSVRAGAIDTVRVALAHLVVPLTAMQVHDLPPCTKPGPPSPTEDQVFASVFDQIKQNADRYRLLSTSYPFVTSNEREIMFTLADSTSRLHDLDTVTATGAETWKYKPGAIVDRKADPKTGFARIHVPTLVEFSDDTFINNHCFYNGGLETLQGISLMRIDYSPSLRLKAIDVGGRLYLEPETFQIRRLEMRLTGSPGLANLHATVLFGDVFPSIPIIIGFTSTNSVLPDPRAKGPRITGMIENQRLLGVKFLKGMPGDEQKKP